MAKGREGFAQPPRSLATLSFLFVLSIAQSATPTTAYNKVLRTRGVRNLVLTGVTTDVCVHTTMRSANDMGYECVLLEVRV